MDALTPDEALAQILILAPIEDEDKRGEILRILQQVRTSGYRAGCREGFDQGTDRW